MRDEEMDEDRVAQFDEVGRLRVNTRSEDIFGEFNVVGPGVHIVLDGRPVSSPNR